MEEKLIVSLTSWPPRFGNLPVVLDSIYNQTVKPDLVVLNISQGDSIPDFLNDYIQAHGVEVNFVPDTKVYKKLIPTLLRYPNDCVISIDDDWIYPEGMIEDFMSTHKAFPNAPISGNKVCYRGLKCHCGCASLMKKEWLGHFINKIDDKLMRSCLSDDLVYTYLAKRNGYEYVRTQGEYFYNMEPFDALEPYSELSDFALVNTLGYLELRFGSLPRRFVEILRRIRRKIFYF